MSEDTNTPPVNPGPELPTNDGNNTRASWNTSTDLIRQNCSHFSADELDLMVALFRWCTDPRHPLRREEAAVRIGCSPELLYQLMRGIYRNPDKTLKRPSEDFIRKARNFLDIEAKRYAAAGSDFVLTPTADKINTACNLARESKSPVILWGPSQIGKTWGLRNYQSNNNHGRTTMVEIEAACGLGGLVRTCAKASGISDKSNTPDLIERLKNAWSPDTLVILDEMHLLQHTYRKGSFFSSIEVLRRIHDYSGFGLVMSWTLLDSLKASSQTELVQIWRRGVHKVALPTMPTKMDLAVILKHYGFEGEEMTIRDKDNNVRFSGVFPSRELKVTLPVKDGDDIVEYPYEILRQVAKTSGLKAITERIRYARHLAGKKKGQVSWHDFVKAHLMIEKQSIQEKEWI